MIITVLLAINFHILFLIKNDFAETLLLTASILGPLEDATATIMMGIIVIDILYHIIIQHQPISIVASMAIDETESVPSTMP